MIEKLKEYRKKIFDLDYTIGLLAWELKINAPVDSQMKLTDLISQYEEEVFKLNTSEEYGNLLNEIVETDEFKRLPDEEQRYILKLRKDYNNFKSIPSEFFKEYSKTNNIGNIKWLEARKNNDYSIYKPYLEKVIDMAKKFYSYLNKDNIDLYDVMLNQYEEGNTSDVIDKVFDELKEGIIPIINNLKTEKKTINVDYSNDELMEISKYLLDYIGFDLNKGALGIYPHGYTTRLNENDIRIAFGHTNDPISLVTTIIHEGGHGIFEQNVKKRIISIL